VYVDYPDEQGTDLWVAIRPPDRKPQSATIVLRIQVKIGHTADIEPIDIDKLVNGWERVKPAM